MEKGPKINSVDEYLERQTEEFKNLLQHLRQQIKKAAPKAEEGISYNMPAYKHNGPLVYFAAFKNHCSFFPASKHVVEKFSKELKGFEATAGTIHFTPEKPLPSTLVQKIVKERLKQNEARQLARKEAKASKIKKKSKA